MVGKIANQSRKRQELVALTYDTKELILKNEINMQI